jgi:O-antigen/teichoic acid export membrane protein
MNPPQRRASSGEGFLANAGAALTLQAVGLVATGILTLILIRLLGPHSYGQYAIALAVGGIVLLPLDAGMTGATGRYLSAETRRAPAAQMIRSGLVLKVAVGALLSGCLVLAAPLIAHGYADERLAWPIRVVAGVVLAQSLLGFVVGCFNAVRLTSRALVVVTIESIGEAAIVTVIVVGGGGVVGALIGRLAAYGVSAAIGLLFLEWRFRLRRRVARPTRTTLKAIGGYGLSLALVDAAWALFVQIDVILIAALLDARAAGEFQAPVRVLSIITFPGLAIASALGPRVFIDSEPSLLGRFRRSLQILVAFQAFAAVTAATAGASLINLLVGPQYHEAASLTRALAPWVLLAGIAPVASRALDYRGAARQRLPYAVGALAVNGLIDVALLPRIGVVGAAIGTDVGMSVYTLGILAVCSRQIGYRLSSFLTDMRPIAVPCIASGLVMLAADLATDNAFLLIAAVVVGSVMFAALLARRPPFHGLAARLLTR